MKVGPSIKVIKYLNQNPNSRAKAIIDSTDLDAQSVYRVLSYLHKTKKLSRRAGKYSVAYDLPMTAITPTQQVTPKNVEQSRQIAALQFEVDKQELLIKTLKEQNEDLKRESTELNIKYYDSQAVVKYLEQKLANVHA